MNRAQADRIMRRATTVSIVDDPCPRHVLYTERSVTLRCPAGWTLACWLHGRPRSDALLAWAPHAVWAHRTSPGRSVLASLPAGEEIARLRAWLVEDPGKRQREALIRHVLRLLAPEAERWTREYAGDPSDDFLAAEPVFPHFWGAGET